MEPTQLTPLGCALIDFDAAAATPSAPPKKNTESGRAGGRLALSASNISDPATRCVIGTPSRRAIQMIGIPSGGQRSLCRIEPLNSEFERACTTKFKLGV